MRRKTRIRGGTGGRRERNEINRNRAQEAVQTLIRGTYDGWLRLIRVWSPENTVGADSEVQAGWRRYFCRGYSTL